MCIRRALDCACASSNGAADVRVVHALRSARAESTAAAYSQVIELAWQGAEAHEETISSVRVLLQIVANVFVKMPFKTVDCNHYLSNLTSNIPWIKALSIQMFQRNPRNRIEIG